MNGQPPAPSIHQSIVRLQGDLGVLVQRLVEGLNRQLAPYKIDAVEYTVLSVCLSSGAIPLSELRRLLPIDPGHMTLTTNLLEDKGLIEKTRLRGNRRVVVLVLTEEGAALTQELTKHVDEFYGLLVRGISIGELAGCTGVMQRMIATGEAAEGRHAPPADQAQGQAIGAYVATLQSTVVTLLNVMFRGIQERVSPFELSVGEYSVFVICFTNGPITMSDLGQHIPISAARISRAVSKMEDRELVRKVRPGRDRRVVIVEMTGKGRALARELMASVEEHCAGIVGRVSEQEMAGLLGFIERMTANAKSAFS